MRTRRRSLESVKVYHVAGYRVLLQHISAPMINVECAINAGAGCQTTDECSGHASATAESDCRPCSTCSLDSHQRCRFQSTRQHGQQRSGPDPSPGIKGEGCHEPVRIRGRHQSRGDDQCHGRNNFSPCEARRNGKREIQPSCSRSRGGAVERLANLSAAARGDCWSEDVVGHQPIGQACGCLGGRVAPRQCRWLGLSGCGHCVAAPGWRHHRLPASASAQPQRDFPVHRAHPGITAEVIGDALEAGLSQLVLPRGGTATQG